MIMSEIKLVYKLVNNYDTFLNITNYKTVIQQECNIVVISEL